METSTCRNISYQVRYLVISPIEMRKVLVAYACGLTNSYDRSHLYDRASENRKMCRGCITTWLPGEIPPVRY